MKERHEKPQSNNLCRTSCILSEIGWGDFFLSFLILKTIFTKVYSLPIRKMSFFVDRKSVVYVWFVSQLAVAARKFEIEIAWKRSHKNCVELVQHQTVTSYKQLPKRMSKFLKNLGNVFIMVTALPCYHV